MLLCFYNNTKHINGFDKKVYDISKHQDDNLYTLYTYTIIFIGNPEFKYLREIDRKEFLTDVYIMDLLKSKMDDTNWLKLQKKFFDII